MQDLKSGAIDGLYAQAPYIEGYNAMTSLVKYLRGAGAAKNPVKPGVPYYTASPLKFITKANLNSRREQEVPLPRELLATHGPAGRAVPAGPFLYCV